MSDPSMGGMAVHGAEDPGTDAFPPSAFQSQRGIPAGAVPTGHDRMKDDLLFSRRDLRRLLIPLIIEQVMLSLRGMVDTIMVSNVGEAAVSGVSLVDSINKLISELEWRLFVACDPIEEDEENEEDDEETEEIEEPMNDP